jgi:ABC-type sugar transport system permease subunit
MKANRNSTWWQRLYHIEPYIFISPFLVCFLVFFLWPILFSFWIGFTDWRGFEPGRFTGLANFATVLGSSMFGKALGNTITYAVITGVVLIPLAFLFAYLLNLSVLSGRGNRLFRSLFFIPITIPVVIMGPAFSLIFGWPNGIFNHVLAAFGQASINWLGEPLPAKLVVVLVFFWRSIGLVMIYFIAGLQGIDESNIEAARIDGAGTLQIIVRVIIPMMRPVMIFVTIFLTVQVFQIFDEPYVLFSFVSMGSAGGPGDAALSMLQLMHRYGFSYQHMGQASVVATAIFVIIFAIAMLQMKYGRFYEND